MKGKALALGAAALAFGSGVAEGKGKADAGLKTPDAVVSSPAGNPEWEKCQADRNQVRVEAADVLAQLEAAARQISVMPVDEKVPLNLEKTQVCIMAMDTQEDPPQFSDGNDPLEIGYTREGWAEQQNRDLADCIASERMFTPQTAGVSLEDCNAKLQSDSGLVGRLQTVLAALKGLIVKK